MPSTPSSSSAAASAHSWQRPPLPAAAHGHGGLPARDQAGGRRHGPPAGLDLAGQADERARHVARLALERAGQNVRRVAERARLRGRGLDDQQIVADHGVGHAAKDRVLGLRRLRDLPAGSALEPLDDRRGRPRAELEAVEDREGLREGGRVGRAGAGGDDVEGIADHVGEQQRVHAGGRRGPRELPALEERAVLPDRVELIDVGARREHEPRHRLLVGQGDGRHRRRGQRRAPARDQDQQEVVGPGGLGERPDPVGRGLAARVGHRVPGLDQADAGRLGEIAVLDHHEAVGDALAERGLGGGGHGARGLPRPHHEHAARGRPGARRPGRGAPGDRTSAARERGVEDRARRLAAAQRASFCSRRPASIRMSSVLGKQKRILVRPSSRVRVEGRARHRRDADLPDEVQRELVVVAAVEPLQEVLGLGEDVVGAAGLVGHEARLLHLARAGDRAGPGSSRAGRRSRSRAAGARSPPLPGAGAARPP